MRQPAVAQTPRRLFPDRARYLRSQQQCLTQTPVWRPLRLPVAVSAFALFGFIRKPTTVAFGSSSRAKNCLPTNSLSRNATPVALPPGRLKLSTNPTFTGSTELMNAIGIVRVAAIAASAAGAPIAVIADTLRLANSAANSGYRS